MDELNSRNFNLTALGHSGRRRYFLFSMVLAIVSASFLDAQPSSGARSSADPQWFVSMSMGEGQLQLKSDQQSWDRVPSFAIGFDLGRQIGPWARAGMEAHGWLLEAFNLNNPGVGESVGHVMVIGDALPLRTRALFARGGFGWSSYTNNRPEGSNGGGLAWMLGGGYEVPVSRSFRLVPTIGYSGGHLGEGVAPTSQTHFRYSVYEFKLGALYRFGS